MGGAEQRGLSEEQGFQVLAQAGEGEERASLEGSCREPVRAGLWKDLELVCERGHYLRTSRTL